MGNPWSNNEGSMEAPAEGGFMSSTFHGEPWTCHQEKLAGTHGKKSCRDLMGMPCGTHGDATVSLKPNLMEIHGELMREFMGILLDMLDGIENHGCFVGTS